MCGKFTQKASWREAQAFSGALEALSAEEPSVVTTPMRFANVLRLDAKGAREVVPMRWGFADRRAGAPDRPKHMHARAETVDARPAFAEAFAGARGILPVETFNQGEDLPSGKSRQWTVAPKDGRPLAIGVICETWAKGEERLDTFAMVTTPANRLISQVTDRMPAILAAGDWPAWLGETNASVEEIKALLRTWDDAGAWDMTPKAPRSEPGGQAELF